MHAWRSAVALQLIALHGQRLPEATQLMREPQPMQGITPSECAPPFTQFQIGVVEIGGLRIPC